MRRLRVWGTARGVRRALRRSLATRLLAGGLAFTVLLIAAVGGVLLLSRSRQAQSEALSNADNRAGVAAQLIDRIAVPQTEYAAAAVAALPAVQQALAGPSPAASLSAALSGNVVPFPGIDVEVVDAHGSVLYRGGCTAAATAACVRRAASVVATESVQRAMTIATNPSCDLPRTAMTAAVQTACAEVVDGVDMVQGAPSIDVAAPVYDSATTYAPLGVVVYSTPLSAEFAHFGPVIGFTPVFVAPGRSALLLRYTAGAASVTAVPAAVSSVLSQIAASTPSATPAHTTYDVDGATVAASFVPLTAPDAPRIAGFIGVEVPVTMFAAGIAQDETTVLELMVTAVVVVAVLVLLFIDRFVRRPVAQLERGVARIAAGDYVQDVDVRSDDELGRLAADVNRMRSRIAEYVGHVDGSLARLQAVSRALTTTGGGVERLQVAVVRAAGATAGAGAAVTLLRREDAQLVAVRGTADIAVLDTADMATLLAGHPVRRSSERGHVLAVPSFLQGAVAGALLVVTVTEVSESDERALQVLGNNGAVALENAAVFEQQAAAVERLRELNRLKSEFLSTTQHELRTPVLALRSQLELLAAAWDRWDDADKREALHDIEVSTTLLSEVVETVVEFSLLSGDAVELRLADVSVREALRGAVDDIARHFKNGVPVPLHLSVAPDIAVRADAGRLREVLRAVIDNAVKFTPGDGQVVVRARAEPEQQRCRIEVCDTGAGIAAEALPHVFDRFYQADNSRTRRVGGMGLGLTLARLLCEAHGATIDISSVPGRGTTVILRWPLADHVPATTPTGLIRFTGRTPVAS